jgi:hypothetical protein
MLTDLVPVPGARLCSRGCAAGPSSSCTREGIKSDRRVLRALRRPAPGPGTWQHSHVVELIFRAAANPAEPPACAK